MKLKNHYHVTYTGTSTIDNKPTSGAVTISIENPIQYQSDVVDIKGFIENNYDMSGVIILNWQPLLGLERTDEKSNKIVVH